MCVQAEAEVLTISEPLSTPIPKTTIVVIVSALLSILAFACIAIRIIRDATFDPSRRPRVLFFRTQLGQYAACLVLSNMFLSGSGLIDIRWLIDSELTPGSTCSTQAVLMQIGIWGTCWFSVAYGMHVLISLVFCVRQVYWHSAVIITIGWGGALVAALLPLMMEDIYGPAGISCGITHSHSNEIIFLGAFPIVLGTSLTTAIYSLTFIVWFMRQRISNKRETRAFSLAYRRGENKPTEYRKLINMVIWTTFWFPLAFVLLMSPFCIIRILVHVEQQVSPALNIFADACASILGFINVGLTFNTLRAISHVSRVSRMVTETVTFGHDASKEFPTDPKFYPQSEISSYESICRGYNSSPASHSHSSSFSSIDSNTELLRAEKKAYASTQTKAAPILAHIIPPAELGRRFDNEPGITSLPPMVNISLGPPPASGETGVIGHKPQMQGGSLFDPMANIKPFGEGTGELGFRPQVPPKVGLSDHPSGSHPILYPITHKLDAPITKKPGIPAASSDFTSQTPAAFLGPKNTDQSIRRVSTAPSFASTGTFSSDSDSDCSGEVMQVYKVRLSSQTGDDEIVFQDSTLPNPQRRSAWARRITMDTIWSQESERMTEDEIQEAYWQVTTELLADLGVTESDQADAPGAAIQRQSTFGPRDARPQALRDQPQTKAMSKCSVHFTSPPIPKSPPPAMKFGLKERVF